MAHIITFQNVNLFSSITLYFMLWGKWSYLLTSVNNNPIETIQQIEKYRREKYTFETKM